MANISSKHNPSFCLYPVNNNRTGWRPFGAPVILVVPHRRTISGIPLGNSQVFNVKVYIEDVPKTARVAGHDHVGLRFPDKELYTFNIDSFGLSERLVKVEDFDFYRTGVPIEVADATYGDYFQLTTSTGIVDQIPYLPGANYYDLSDILIDFEHLPSDDYNLVYQAEYFTRILSEDSRQEFLCLDTNSISLALLKFKVRHPGFIIEEFERHTPAPYLTNAEKSKDTTLALYRPFTDSLENVYDEQDLLESVNWVYDAPPEVIPYLSQLLGWDLPYFPRSLDRLRKAVLRRTVEFQNLTGSKRAIIDLFRLFGFEILITNLWWSSDGKRLIRPDDQLPYGYQDEQITTVKLDQIEPLLVSWSKQGFGQFTIPLLFRPQTQPILSQYSALLDGGDVTIESFVVSNQSQAYGELISICELINTEPQYYAKNNGGLSTDINGYFVSSYLNNKLSGLQLDGYSKCLITGKLGEVTKEASEGINPVTAQGVSLDRSKNLLNLTLNGDLNLDNQSVFCFAYYKRFEYSVPDIIKELQSNRFDVQIVTQELTDFADPTVLDFALEFLDKIKAFHSLLNKVIFTVELNESYLVTDWCVGGDFSQRWDIDAGKLQVPPAIIPNIPNDITDCSKLDPKSLGYKDSDILLRLRLLSNLPEEYAAWDVLDARADQPTGPTRLPIAPSAAGRDKCKFTYLGQDRVIDPRINMRTHEIGPSPNSNSLIAGYGTIAQESPIDLADNGFFDSTGPTSSSNSDSSMYGAITREFTQNRQPWCTLDESTDYCYKGRVDDDILYRPTLLHGEQIVFKPCSIDLGIGVYYTFPSYSIPVIRGVQKPAQFSRTPRVVYSGGALTGGEQIHLKTIQKTYLTAPYGKPLQNESLLSRLYRDYDNPQDFTLHYSDRPIGDVDQRHNLALARPTINIQKTTLHLPGCRFATINALLDDFYHPMWQARPWDDDFSTYCGPQNICGDKEPDFLNCTLETDTDGNEHLVFDQRPFQILGNGMVPDISSLGDHTLTPESVIFANDVIHKVYMQNADKSNECLQLDSVCDYDYRVTSEGVKPGVLAVDKPIFNSYANCGTSIMDFADGYACSAGFLSYQSLKIAQDESYEEILLALGLETEPSTDSPNQMLVYLGSGILAEDALRLDCGCLLVNCNNPTDGYADTDSICSANVFIDQLGNYDWDPAHVQINPTMNINERLGACSIQLDGHIRSLLETI